MRVFSGLCLSLLVVSLCILQTKAQVIGKWQLLETVGDGFDSGRWQCTKVTDTFDCAGNPTPNSAQTISGISLGASTVVLPACGSAPQTLSYQTSGSPILWPNIDERVNYCYTLNIIGTNLYFSAYYANPMPSLVIGNGFSNDINVEQQISDMIIPSLRADNSKLLNIAANNIKIQTFYVTKATTVTFKKGLSGSAATSNVSLDSTTINYTTDLASSSVWNLNSVAGLTFGSSFSMTSLTSNYQLSIYNQTGSTGANIKITAQTFTVSNSKLNLNSVTSGTASTISGSAVTLTAATLNLVGLWTISAPSSFSGNGTLDLTSALPVNGFTLPSTHSDHTIKLPASSTLLATGSFSQVTLSSTGSFTVDRQNTAGVMDIKSITTGSAVTLKNGKFRLASTSASIFLISAELTIVGSVGNLINGDADSTVIIDSSTAGKNPPVTTDGDLRLWNHEYLLFGSFSAGKGIFLEKKTQTEMYVTTLPNTLTVDDATCTFTRPFIFGEPIIVQNNGILTFSPEAELNFSYVNVSLTSGAQIINNIPFTPVNDVTFGTKDAKEGEFLSYAPIVISNVTFTTDKLTLKENASLTVEAAGVVSASSLYADPSSWVDFAGAIHLTGDFVNDGDVYWGGKDTVGTSALIGNYAQNANGTTYLTVTSLNDTQPLGEYDSLTVTGDVFVFGTLQLEFVDTASALALPDQAWYPIITLTGNSGGVFDIIEHNLGAEVTLNVCFTATQGILVFNHNTAVSAVEFVDLPVGCDFVNAVPISAPVAMEPTTTPDSSTISSAVTFAVSYIALLASIVVLTVC